MLDDLVEGAALRKKNKNKQTHTADRIRYSWSVSDHKFSLQHIPEECSAGKYDAGRTFSNFGG